MAVDINRRNAFAHAFRLYPDILRDVAQSLKIVDHATGEDITTKEHKFDFPKILCAQFAVRLIKTRCEDNGDDLMIPFAMATTARYKKFVMDTINVSGKFEIQADPKRHEALLAVEDGMATSIFNALGVEANIETLKEEMEKSVDPTTERRIVPHEINNDFDEADFWADVFRALIQGWKPGYPQLGTGLEAVILDHIKEFRAAINGQVLQ